MSNTNFTATWSKAWADTIFKNATIIGILFFIALLLFFPLFFRFIETRNAIFLTDPLLNVIPAQNLSVPIFLIIYSTTIFTLYKCLNDPSICIIFLWSFIIMSLLRIISITIIPLEPPANLIEIKDPISFIFYGNKFITKDLFFSGHTATQFLMFLSLKNRRDKIITLISTLIIGIMVLIQHVHYTADVLAAPIAAYISYWITNIFFKKYLK